MEILFISDTHALHQQLDRLPEADLLIYGGDVSKTGARHEVEDFIRWFSLLDYEHKIFIAGNHDFYLENVSAADIRNMLPENTSYLFNSGICIKGITIWGSPVTPCYHNWAFNRKRGYEIRRYWNLIPPNTDILITHGPPAGILDKTTSGESVGCSDLFDTVQKIKPRYHLFGHIHEQAGMIETNETVFINGSLLNEKYKLSNKPVLFEMD